MLFLDGNRIELLRNGAQFFPALCAAIDSARHEVHLETYIFADDAVGESVVQALARAAGRGVRVRVLVDGFGSSGFPARLQRMLADGGAEIRLYRPVRFWGPWREGLRRLHRKTACIDNAVAFVGGINIVDDVEPGRRGPPRFDYAVRIEGPLSARVRAEAARLWARLAAGRRAPVPPAPDPAPGPRADGVRAALVVRDSFRHRRDIERAYRDLIDHARDEVIIANAYFLPRRGLRLALQRAARRGVRVALVLQGQFEYLLLHLASRATYERLLAAGVEIWEYRRSFLHAKVATFDARVACVGSSNLDPYSLLLARESNVFVDDAGFTATLRASLLEEMSAGAERITHEAWRQLPWWRRVRFRAAVVLMRALLAFAGIERYR